MTDTALLGLDLGTVNIKLVVLDPEDLAGVPRLNPMRPSRGNPLRAARELLQEAATALGNDAPVRIGLTGAAAMSASGGLERLSLGLNEVVAAAAGVGVAHPEIRTVVDLGGQFSKWILIDQSTGDPLGRVADFALNGLCAAGSGAFLEQQASRLKMSLSELSTLAAGAKRGATIAGRCSVFAKSDMIHLQQKGTPADEIAYGLCLALARTFVATVLEGRKVEPPVALVVGGASNPGLVRALLEIFGLDEDDLVVPKQHLYACARGAALAAAAAPAVALGDVLVEDAALPAMRPAGGGLAPHPRLPITETEVDDPMSEDSGAQRTGSFSGHLGVDVGSVSTNVVLLSEELELLEEIYVPTRGRPVEALDEALGAIEARFDGGADDLEVLSVGATGSGRYLADRLVGADLVKNEITAQLVSAARYVPEVDAVFEIGIVAGCFLRPREVTPGAVDQALRDCYEMVERCGAEGTSARSCLARCMDRLDKVPLGPEQSRPIVGVTGDLYTRISEAGNASLFERLEAMGCTVWPSPFVGSASDFEWPQNARRWLTRGEPKKALKDQAAAMVLRTRSALLASVLARDLRERCVEPPQSVLQEYAVRYVGANANHLVRSLVVKIVDFASRGADGVISAVGLGCMVGVTVAAAIPAIRRDHGGLPVVSIAYGGTEGPAQQIQLETFVHQVKQRFERRSR